MVNTDSGALKYWQNLKNPRVADFRWLQELSEFPFTVKHRPGKLNTNADQLITLPEVIWTKGYQQKSFKLLLTIISPRYYGRYIQCDKCVAKEAKEVTAVLYRDIICRYGTPLQIVTTVLSLRIRLGRG